MYKSDSEDNASPVQIMEQNEIIEEKQEQRVSSGFDRGLKFEKIKKKLIKNYKKIINTIRNLNPEDKHYVSKRRMNILRLIYNMIAMIQFRNGSRISEGVDAFIKFINEDNYDDKILVKIAKSKAQKQKKDGKKFITKERYRKMIFPMTWIKKIKFLKYIKKYLKVIPHERLEKRVLDFLRTYFNCNTHSLRYAFINYMLYDKKKEMPLVAKFVGHSSVAQLVRYTQNIEADKIFNEDI